MCRYVLDAGRLEPSLWRRSAVSGTPRRERHPGHFDATRIGDDSLWSGEASRPIALGCQSLSLTRRHPLT